MMVDHPELTRRGHRAHTERVLIFSELGGMKVCMVHVINRLHGGYRLLVMGYRGFLWVIGYGV